MSSSLDTDGWGGGGAGASQLHLEGCGLGAGGGVQGRAQEGVGVLVHQSVGRRPLRYRVLSHPLRVERVRLAEIALRRAHALRTGV